MDIGTAVQEAAKEVQAAHPGRNILIETSGDLEGEWDRARVGQVLSNLIGNAVLRGVKTSAIAVAAKGASSTTHGRKTVVDLGEVDFVDPAGESLLARLHAEGVELVAVTPLICAVLQEICRAPACGTVGKAGSAP